MLSEEQYKEMYKGECDIPVYRIFMLRDMAHENIGPNYRFSDVECYLYELFKECDK